MSRRILLTVAYDGTEYHGFARQAGEPATIEENIDRAIYGLTGEATAVIGASRTDSGVHLFSIFNLNTILIIQLQS